MQSKFCKIPNGNIHYLEAGSGKTVILLPGIWITSRSLEEVGVVLAMHFHIIIPDLFKGRSTFSVSPNKLDDYSKALFEFIKKLNISNFSLVGWSIGGLIVSSYAQTYSSNLNKLIFINSSTMHQEFMEKPEVIFRGYIRLIGNNLLTLKGIRINSLWFFDALRFFLRHPHQFLKEIQIGMYDRSLIKATKMPVVSKLLIAEKDEFVDSNTVKGANQNINNLEVKIVKGRHDWLYYDESLLMEELVHFLS